MYFSHYILYISHAFVGVTLYYIKKNLNLFQNIITNINNGLNIMLRNYSDILCYPYHLLTTY